MTKEKAIELYTDYIVSSEDRLKCMGKSSAELYMIGIVDFLNVILSEIEKEDKGASDE